MARMSIDELTARLRSQQAGAPPDQGFAARREQMERLAARAPLPAGTVVTPVDAGGVPAEWVVGLAVDHNAPGVLYLHGGGYTMGSRATHRALAGHLSAAAGAGVLTIDYRLAPEDPFPAGLEDAVTAWQWMTTEGNVDPQRAVVGGDSAGGGLAAALLLTLVERGLPLPAGAFLLSPWVDLTLGGESLVSRAGADPVVSAASLAANVAAYVPGGAPANDPLVSPVFGDWFGMPPLLIQVGTAEVLLDDSRRLAEAAAAQGVDARLEEWDGMIHVWQMYCGLLDEATQAVERLADFIVEVTA